MPSSPSPSERKCSNKFCPRKVPKSYPFARCETCLEATRRWIRAKKASEKEQKLVSIGVQTSPECIQENPPSPLPVTVEIPEESTPLHFIQATDASSNPFTQPFLAAVTSSLPSELESCFGELKDACTPTMASLGTDVILDNLLRFVCGARYNGYSRTQMEEWTSGQAVLRESLDKLLSPSPSNSSSSSNTPTDVKARDAPVESSTQDPCRPKVSSTLPAFSSSTAKRGRFNSKFKLLKWISTEGSIPKEFLPFLPPCSQCKDSDSDCTGPILKGILDLNAQAIISLTNFGRCKRCKTNKLQECTYSKRKEPEELRKFVVNALRNTSRRSFLRACNKFHMVQCLLLCIVKYSH